MSLETPRETAARASLPAVWGMTAPAALGAVPVVVAIAGIVGVLYLAQDFLVPFALAVFITFALSPLVRAVERRRVPRHVAILLVLTLALALGGVVTYLLTSQFRDLARHVPEYSASIRSKLSALRLTRHGLIADIQKTVEDATHELQKPDRATQARVEEAVGPPGPQSVVVVPAEPSDLERLRMVVAPVVQPLLEAGIVLVLVLFMLMKREDLRNRVIRLAGIGHVTLTTRTMDEAGQRIGRYLLTQSVINAGFGLVVAAGLAWIGVPYAALWGVLAACLRFVPYIGAILALAMPTVIAAVQFDGWAPVAQTVALFVGMDLLTANILEPWIIGHHTGVSSLALLVSALFWSWLWGPIGLLLSTPIAVCLMVLGKYVPRLEFLAVLFGDEPVLEPEIGVYQRLLAGDEDEANEIVDQAACRAPLEEVFDAVLLPAVLRSASDLADEHITDVNHEFVLRATAEIVARLGEAEVAAVEPAPAGRPCVLAVPAHNAADELAVAMLQQLVDAPACQVVRASPMGLAPELEAGDVAAVCIAALPPGGMSAARHLCRRVRARYGRVAVIVLRPGSAPSIEGAECAGSLAEARRLIDAVLDGSGSQVESERADRARQAGGLGA